jgi:ABC-type transport system substrate-binding protein
MRALSGERVDRRTIFIGIAMAGIMGFSALGLSRCDNSPYRKGEAGLNTMYWYYVTPPSKLDPATAYYSHEGDVIDTIYEPPFDYHYLKRPYELVPLTAEAVPRASAFDAAGNLLAEDAPAEQVARVEYVIRIRPGIRYQPHPCFVRNADGSLRYGRLTGADLRGIESPNDFAEKSTRELTAEDYVYGVRRLADPRVPCPVQPTIARYVRGFDALGAAYARMIEDERARRRAAAGAAYDAVTDEKRDPIRIDYSAVPFEGFQSLDRYTIRVVLTRRYPQILYWMAMHFFAPVPPEAIEFYTQAPLIERQISLNTWPVGTGAYFLKEYEPNRVLVLERNPNFHEDYYPADGDPEDRAGGLLADAGKRTPLNDRVVMVLEKEPIPQWNKFLQGYYDTSVIAPEAFEKAVNLAGMGEASLSDDLRGRGITMKSSVVAGLYYVGFNMRDDLVGGTSLANRKLRQAVSIALDYNEFLDIFFNGQGLNAQGPLPPGIFGARAGEAGVNPVTDEWSPTRRKAVRRPLDVARKLLAEAGYPDGRRADGRPLLLYLDHSMGGEPSFASRFDWMRKRLGLIGIILQERGTELKRYREKMDQGAAMLFMQGWYADYPDPENFLFLFYGPNARCTSLGENSANYKNAEYDRLFERMEGMPNGPERQAVIDRMVSILREDAPACWGFHPLTYSLQQPWYRNSKPNLMSKNIMKYKRVDTAARVRLQREWNRPRIWPVLAVEAVFLVSLWPAIVAFRRREREEASGC